MIAKGQITTQLRDAATLELIDEQVVNNIVTEEFYIFMAQNQAFKGMDIIINGKSIAPSRFQSTLPSNVDGNFALSPSSSIPSREKVEFFPAAGDTPSFVQFSGRYLAPSVNRTIKTVMLVTSETQGNMNSADNTTTKPFAYSRLNSPCVQTTSQVLDVFYRLFFPADGSVPPHLVNEHVLRMCRTEGMSWLFNRNSFFDLPIVIKAKAGDELRSLVADVAHRHTAIELNGKNFSTPMYQGFGTNARRQISWDSGLTDMTGVIFSSLIAGGYDGGANLNSMNANDDIGQSIALMATRLRSASKIQNLIGHGTAAKPVSASPWLDVDNLPTGSGKIFLSGAWNNISAPSAPGLYYPTLLPQWNTIQVKTAGQVGNGSASYQYKKRAFFGAKTMCANGGYTDSPSGYSLAVLASLCGTSPSYGKTSNNGPVNMWQRVTWDAGKTLVGDITKTFLDTPQISSAHKYDNGSFILVKKNEILLYNIGAGDYWKFTGPYTDIHQIAVVQGVIYVACRNTGLYAINPVSSLEVVSLAGVAAGIDLSKCNGVAKGYGNVLWAVANDGLVKYDGAVWTKYNEASSPAFSIAGVSDNKWGNIEYLKVDESSIANEMMLVRRLTADTNAASFGVWWSTATAATNAFNDVLTPGMGRPRLNRTHFGGSDGLWAIANGKHKVMAFGSTAPTDVVGVAAIADVYRQNEIYCSIFFVKNEANQTRLMTMHDVYSSHVTSNRAMTVKLVNSAGVVTDTLNSGLAYGENGSYTHGPFGKSTSRARAGGLSGYGYCDSTATIILDKGVMVTLWCGTENNFDEYGDRQYDKIDNLIVGVSNYGFDLSLGGGPLAYLAETTYGWNGSAWVANEAAGKPMHLDEQPLGDGVMVRFQEGAQGTSFQLPNYYKFGLCEGLLKDNATRHNYTNHYHTRKHIKNSPFLSAYFVPAPSQLPAGEVSVLHTDKTSTGTFTNATKQVVFPSEAGFQYGVATEQVTGDFEITYAHAHLLTTQSNHATAFGVGKAHIPKSMFGFHMSQGTLCYVNGLHRSYVGITSSLNAITSLKIKRTAGVLTLWFNDTLRATNDPDATNIRLRDDRLDLCFHSQDTSNPYFLIPDRYCPKTTITTNGSDCMVYAGNIVTKTGSFHARFCGIDVNSDNIVALNGVNCVVKYDGTEALQGQAVIDPLSGAIYFNAADQGKAITCSISYLQSE